MDGDFLPKINCRFRIRRDIAYHVGFFQGKGVLTFNEVGAFIVSRMTGEKSLQEISQLVEASFSTVENPMVEVMFIAEQLQESGFF